jgi:hypothetical protein
MRTLTSITLALFTSVLTSGCLTPQDDPAAGDGEIQSAELTATPEPVCPDKHAQLLGQSRSCILHDGTTGIRLCTDHITFHYFPRWDGIPPNETLTCVATGTDVTTTCGPCQAIVLP